MAWYTRLRRIKKSVVYDYLYFFFLLYIIIWDCRWLFMVPLNNELREKCVIDTTYSTELWIFYIFTYTYIDGVGEGQPNLFAVG